MIALNTVMICIETKQILFILECLINKNLPKSNPRNNFMYPTYLKSLSFSFLINTIDRRNRVVFLLSVSTNKGSLPFYLTTAHSSKFSSRALMDSDLSTCLVSYIIAKLFTVFLFCLGIFHRYVHYIKYIN